MNCLSGKKILFVSCWSRALVLAGSLFTASVVLAENLPSMQEAQAQLRVWQQEVSRYSRSGDVAGLAEAQGQVRDWQGIVNQLEARARQAEAEAKAREYAAKADELARQWNISPPAGLSSEQRVQFITRRAIQLEEQAKSEKERQQQQQLAGQLQAAITSGDYNRAKAFVDQGAKATPEMLQLALDSGYTGIGYLIIKNTDGLDPVAVDKALGKALIKAAQIGDATRVDNLITKLGADPNFQEGAVSPMSVAASRDDMQMVGILLSKGARRDPAALNEMMFKGVVQGNTDKVRNLIQMGANPNYGMEGASALGKALERGDYGMVGILSAGGAAADPGVLGRALFQAVQEGNADKVQALLKLGADVNFTLNGMTPLTQALTANNAGVANALIQAGAREPTLRFAKQLFDAALSGDMALVSVLGRLSNYVNYQNGAGESPLHAAASRGQLQVMEVLLRAGADPNLRTVKQWTPVHHAARFGHKLALINLLKAGADPYAINSDGNDAAKLAVLAMRDKNLEADGRGILDYLNLWRQYHPPGTITARQQP
ncbi:MAG TPA: ankyrin repeat domain-containing protein [Thiolinea sp.]|nr:ankyrin repeat domain-containing protein [Thiolinea sp.]